MNSPLDKIGSIGAVIAAAACPICFPKLAIIGAMFGLGAFSAYEYELLLATQVLVGVAVLGHAIVFLGHRRPWPLAIAVVSGVAVFAGLYVAGSEWLIYAGFAGLVYLSFRDVWKWMRPRTA
jgi:mercuric ion transport protein